MSALASAQRLMAECLNPCCNGIYSMSWSISIQHLIKSGLNPCCNGIYSMRIDCFRRGLTPTVLILVVMEYTQ